MDVFGGKDVYLTKGAEAFFAISKQTATVKQSDSFRITSGGNAYFSVNYTGKKTYTKTKFTFKNVATAGVPRIYIYVGSVGAYATPAAIDTAQFGSNVTTLEFDISAYDIRGKEIGIFPYTASYNGSGHHVIDLYAWWLTND